MSKNSSISTEPPNHSNHSRASRSSRIAAVAFALVFPTFITWLYFIALRDQPSATQQLAYAITKTLQFGFPLAWVALYDRRRLRFNWRLHFSDLGLGLAFGLLVSAAMVLLYAFLLKPAGFFDTPAAAVREKIIGLGLTEVWKYALVGAFYALGHSLLEEYYWRWFVFGQLRPIAALPSAVAISSVGFMSHHVLVLATYFGWYSPATWLFSLSVAVGGAIWALLYHRSGSLLVPWIGHCLVDAAIFAIGYDLVRDVFP